MLPPLPKHELHASLLRAPLGLSTQVLPFFGNRTSYHMIQWLGSQQPFCSVWSCSLAIADWDRDEHMTKCQTIRGLCQEFRVRTEKEGAIAHLGMEAGAEKLWFLHCRQGKTRNQGKNNEVHVQICEGEGEDDDFWIPLSSASETLMCIWTRGIL